MDTNSREKKLDLPPTGSRNADPITDAPARIRSRPASGPPSPGPSSGLAVGAVAGPIAAAVGAAAGAVAGGYAGKGIGEFIDPTTDDDWLRDHFHSRPYVEEGDTFEDFSPAFRHGAMAESKYGDAGIDLMDEQLQSDWEASKESDMPWTKAKGAVQDAYDRTVQIRRARERPETSEAVQDV